MRQRAGRTWVPIAAGGIVVLGAIVLILFADTETLKHLTARTASKAQSVEPSRSPQPRALAVRVVSVRRGELDHRIGLTGDIEAEVSVQVFSKLPEFWKSSQLRPGTMYKPGNCWGESSGESWPPASIRRQL